MGIFKDKTLLITGGTGSFGNAMMNRFFDTDIGEIRSFPRREKVGRYAYPSRGRKACGLYPTRCSYFDIWQN